MPQKTPVVFISYCSRPTENIGLAIKLEENLKHFGIETIFDRNDLKVWDNITMFMDRVQKSEVVALLVNSEYLYSQACMYEASLALKKAPNRILPVVLDPRIFKPDAHIDYIHYWNQQCDEYKQKLTSNLSHINEIEYIHRQIEKCAMIANKMPVFLQHISASKSPEYKNAASSIHNHLKKMGFAFNQYELMKNQIFVKGSECLGMSTNGKSDHTNKNELVNWYFYDPINQFRTEPSLLHFNERRCTSYFIDMWMAADYNDKPLFHIDMTNNGVKCTLDGYANKDCYVYQMIEYPERFSNSQLTLSIETTELYNIDAYIQILFNTRDQATKEQNFSKKIQDIGITSLTFKMPKDVTACMVRITLRNDSLINTSVSGYGTFGQIKLENGSQSTLKNDLPPIRHVELLKCQRFRYHLPENTYIRASANFGTTAVFKIELPVPIRTNPAIINADNLRIVDFSEPNKKLEQKVYVQGIQKGNILDIQVSLQDHSHNLPNDPVLFIGKDVFYDCNF